MCELFRQQSLAKGVRINFSRSDKVHLRVGFVDERSNTFNVRCVVLVAVLIDIGKFYKSCLRLVR